MRGARSGDISPRVEVGHVHADQRVDGDRMFHLKCESNTNLQMSWSKCPEGVGEGWGHSIPNVADEDLRWFKGLKARVQGSTDGLRSTAAQMPRPVSSRRRDAKLYSRASQTKAAFVSGDSFIALGNV